MDSQLVQKRKRSTSTSAELVHGTASATSLTATSTSVGSGQLKKAQDEYDFDSHESKLVSSELQAEPKKKVQKAMKRTMKRVESVNAGAVTSRRSRTKPRVDYGQIDDDDDELDKTDETVPRTFMLSNNLRLTCAREQFKCVECGHTDIKSHYKYGFFFFFSIDRLK